MNPRENRACPECPGEFHYAGQVQNARGEVVSEFECNNCGRTELVR